VIADCFSKPPTFGQLGAGPSGPPIPRSASVKWRAGGGAPCIILPPGTESPTTYVTSLTTTLSAGDEDQLSIQSIQYILHQLSGTLCLQLRKVLLPSPGRHQSVQSPLSRHITSENCYTTRNRLTFLLSPAPPIRTIDTCLPNIN